MPIREITPELAKIAKDELGEVTSRIPDDLQAIKDWLSKQRHINARTDDQWLIAFLRGCKWSLERTKEKLDNFYTMKTMVPEISVAVDPRNEAIQEMLKKGCCVPLSKPTGPDGLTVMVIRPGAYDANKYTVMDSMRLSHMITEIQLLEDDHTTIVGQRFIIDLKNVTMGHFTQMTPTTIKKMVMTGEQALPIRQKGTHHVNTPAGVETIFTLFKSFMNEKNRTRVHVHNEDFEALYQFVPKEILPTEYGGDAGPIEAMTDYWAKKLESYRDWFLEDVQYKSDESKRPGRPKTAESLFGLEGSFRQLTVD